MIPSATPIKVFFIPEEFKARHTQITTYTHADTQTTYTHTHTDKHTCSA